MLWIISEGFFLVFFLGEIKTKENENQENKKERKKNEGACYIEYAIVGYVYVHVWELDGTVSEHPYCIYLYPMYLNVCVCVCVYKPYGSHLIYSVLCVWKSVGEGL